MFPSSTSNDSAIISSSASSSSSSSPFSHFPNNNNKTSNNINNKTSNNNNNNKKKTMEEVWKDITITSLPNTPLPNHYININNNNTNHMINNPNHTIHHPTPTTNYRGIILQDFLNCNPNNNNNSPPNYQQQQQKHDQVAQHGPTTTLKLTNNEFQQLYEPTQNCYEMQQGSTHQNYSAFGTFDALASASVFASFGGGGGGVAAARKRSPEESTPEENVTVDRRYKRMIKNRESAARSRARKQAYITELELEVAHLAEENARLRKQQQQLLEAPSTQQTKKHGLYRTSTAPF